MSEDRATMVRELYEMIKTNPTVPKYINWDAFSRHAEAVGLHYDERFGLMTKRAWEALKPFIKDSDV